jgi:hypothetical protein
LGLRTEKINKASLTKKTSSELMQELMEFRDQFRAVVADELASERAPDDAAALERAKKIAANRTDTEQRLVGASQEDRQIAIDAAVEAAVANEIRKTKQKVAEAEAAAAAAEEKAAADRAAAAAAAEQSAAAVAAAEEKAAADRAAAAAAAEQSAAAVAAAQDAAESTRCGAWSAHVLSVNRKRKADQAAGGVAMSLQEALAADPFLIGGVNELPAAKDLVAEDPPAKKPRLSAAERQAAFIAENGQQAWDDKQKTLSDKRAKAAKEKRDLEDYPNLQLAKAESDAQLNDALAERDHFSLKLKKKEQVMKTMRWEKELLKYQLDSFRISQGTSLKNFAKTLAKLREEFQKDFPTPPPASQ